MKVHFISGLPRSGSTLLAGILRQNPRFVAGISGPVSAIFKALLASMSGANEGVQFIHDHQRRRILRSMIESYYAEVPASNIIFDTNRDWCCFLPSIVELFPDARIVCCVRNIAWILDSVERQIQRNWIRPSKLFNFDPTGNVSARVDMLMKVGFVGTSLNALRQAWFCDNADRMIAVRYESLTERPQEIIRRLYETLDEPHFEHDFENIDYDEPEFDHMLGLPGFHKVAPRVERHSRATILPPDIFCQYDRSFWDIPGQNPRGVTIL